SAPIVVPATAGTHLSATQEAARWMPAFAGMTARSIPATPLAPSPAGGLFGHPPVEHQVARRAGEEALDVGPAGQRLGLLEHHDQRAVRLQLLLQVEIHLAALVAVALAHRRPGLGGD